MKHFLGSSRRNRLCAAFCVLVSAGSVFAAAPIPAQDDFLSFGQEQQLGSLTDAIFSDYSDLLYNILEIKLTPAQRAKHRELVEGYWQRNSTQNIKVVHENAGWNRKVREEMTPEMRKVFYAEVQGASLKQLAKEAKEGLTEAKWLLDIYYQQHPILAKGNPPLTRDIVDDVLELNRVLESMMNGKDLKPVSSQEKQRGYREWAAEWSKLSPAKREKAAELQGKVAALKTRWLRMSPEERILTRLHMTGGKGMSLRDRMIAQQIEQRMRHMASTHNTQMIQNELNHMRQNQQIIMGSGPYWNPAANRWEQRGGIVTEFH
ncbi:MAG: hypothetical protein OHK0029_34760 [Armatimonadaceae bacterium]